MLQPRIIAMLLYAACEHPILRQFCLKFILDAFARGALKFAILSILEYTGVVFLDNSFHQKVFNLFPLRTDCRFDKPIDCRVLLQTPLLLFQGIFLVVFRGMQCPSL
jgi:hypothetical protein